MAVAGQRLQRATVNRTQEGRPEHGLTLDAARGPLARPPSGNAKDALDTVVSDDGVEHRYLPRSALRASLGRLKRSRAVSRRKPMAPREPGRKWRSRVQTPVAHAQPGWHRHLAPRSADRPDASDAAGRSAGGSRRRHWQTAGCGARAFKRLRRTRSRAGIGASLRAARVARTPQTQPGGQRAKACGAKGSLPGCGARAFERSLAEVVSERAFGGRTLARALPRSYDRAWARRAGAPAPYRLRRPPWTATAQTARLACAHAAEDGRARSEPESA